MRTWVWSFFYQFGLSCLHGKIALCKGDLLLLGVSILDNEIAGVTREHEI